MSHSRPVLLLLVLLASALTTLAVAATAAGATPCGTRVAEDWRDNSRIDGIYPLHCYEEGIDAIPSEIRDYSNAEEVIRQAYLAAGGRGSIGGGPKSPTQQRPSGPAVAAPEVDTSASSEVPLPVLVLGAMSILLVASGAIGYVSRRRSSADDDVA